MQCLKIEELLSSYLDGELSPPLREDVASHLAVCDSCREEYEALSEVVNTIKGLPEVAPPSNFSALVMDKVAAAAVQAPVRKRSGIAAVFASFNRSSWSRVLSVAAAFVLVFGLTALMYGTPDRWGKDTPPVRVHEQPGVAVPGDNSQPDNQARERKPGESQVAVQENGHSGQPAPGQESGRTEEMPGLAGGEAGVDENGVGATGDTGTADSAGAPAEPQKIAEIEGTIFSQVAYGEVPVPGDEPNNSVRGATLALSTENPSAMPEKIANLAGDNGGYLVSKGAKKKRVAVKVPAERFDEVLNGIQEMGATDDFRIENKDVSEQLYSYEDKLRGLAKQKQELLSALKNVESQAESQVLLARLIQVQKDMEEQKELYDKLLNATQLATIEVNLD